jgi:hypothetical protein
MRYAKNLDEYSITLEYGVVQTSQNIYEKELKNQRRFAPIRGGDDFRRNQVVR